MSSIGPLLAATNRWDQRCRSHRVLALATETAGRK